MESLGADWRNFESRAIGTLYQTYIWCKAWLETVGQTRDVEACIVVLRDGHEQIHAILPLQRRRAWSITVLEWLGSPHASYGCGLYSPAFFPLAHGWMDANWPLVIQAAGHCDIVHLRDMPLALEGDSNPLAGLFNLRAPNRSYAMRLSPGFEAMCRAKRSSDDRRSARKKEAGLAKIGLLEFSLPGSKAELHNLLDTMFAQQERRLAERGVHGVFGPDEQRFIHRIAELQDEANPVLAPYNLKCNGKPLAIMLGGIHGGTYWALVSSLASGASRKYSPGDLALRKTIEACCLRGLNNLDFSAGSNRYKESWADDTIQLFNHISARSLAGFAVTTVIAARLALKRIVKETPALMALANTIRRGLRGSRQG